MEGELFGPVPLKVCARLPWSAGALVVADSLFPMDQVRGRWRGRFSVAVRLDPDGNGGTVSLVRPRSAERTDASFTLLPAADVTEERGAADFSADSAGAVVPTYAAVRDAFRSLPSALEYAWSVDPPAEALLVLGTAWRVLPRAQRRRRFSLPESVNTARPPL